jgi:hypothetical protein
VIYFTTVSVMTIQISCRCLPYFSFHHRKINISVICVIMKSVRTWKQLCHGILNYINQHKWWVTYLLNRHYGVYCSSLLVNHWKITIIINTKYAPPPNRATAPNGPQPPFYRSCTITLRHTTLIRSPLGEWSAWRWASTWQETKLSKDSHPWTRWDSNPQSKQASKRLRTHPLDSAATGIDHRVYLLLIYFLLS